MNASVCSCGHGAGLHEHFRPGSDCAKCNCESFTAPRRAAFTPFKAILHVMRKPFPVYQSGGVCWGRLDFFNVGYLGKRGISLYVLGRVLTVSVEKEGRWDD